MAVSVNPVRNDNNDASLVLGALNLARDLYKVNLDDKAMQRAEALKQQAMVAEQATKTEGQQRDFMKDFQEVPEGTKGAVALKIPGQEKTGLFLPRADLRAQEANKTAALALGDKKQTEKVERDYKKTQDLSSDYLKESKSTVSAIEGFKKLEAAALNPNPSGATDVALLFGFMKSIDPGSTVREGEFATAEQAQGVPAQIRNMYNKVMQGERLTPEKRKEFLEEGKRSLQAQLGTQKMIDKSYITKAQNFGVDPKFVVNQQFEELRNELGDLKLAGQNAGGFRGPLGPNQAGQPGVAYGAANPIMQPGTIFTRGGKRYQVNPDGQSATEMK